MDNNIFYTKEHEWIKVDGDEGIVGITKYAQSELGDIIFVELPDVGDTFDANEVFGTIEAVKTVADLYIPVKSKVISLNDSLESKPENINNDPLGDGWIVKVKIENHDELSNLLSKDEYNKFIKNV